MQPLERFTVGRPATRAASVLLVNENGTVILKKLIVAAALASCVSVPALAQDSAPFSGPYVAGMIGYEVVDLRIPDADTNHDDGLLYGGVIGYDVNLNGAVIGFEGEYADSNTKYSASDVFLPGDSARIGYGRDLYAGVRIGGEVAPNMMVYAKGGYTNAKVEGRYDDGVDVFTDSEKLEGYRLGAGVETNTNGLLGRLEYRYSSYGEFQGNEVERHQVALILGYRF